MDIIFSANNNEEIKIMPIVPNDIEIVQSQSNEEFETLNSGTLNLIGELGLRNLSIQSFFPCNEYRWIKKGASTDGWSYVDFFQKWRNRKVPIRIVMISKIGRQILNMPCTIDEFSHAEKRNGDIAYTLEIKEYTFVGV
jgi:hypothetical protein